MQKVLIVDDEPRNRRILCEILDGAVDAKVACSGEEALSILSEYAADLVLLDIMMPGIDGYTVCAQIRKNPKLKFTKVILVSGKALLEERLRGYEVGADDYLSKPFVAEELLAKANVFLRLASTEIQLRNLNQSLDAEVRKRTSQLLQAEAKLINSAKMCALGEMAGGIAHEINTPLGTISLLNDQIQEVIGDHPIDQALIREMTEKIQSTVARIGTIIHGLKNFSREGSRDRLDYASIKQILDNTLSLCTEKLKHKQISLYVDSFPEDLKIQCRPVQISQVLLNLVSNASDAISTLHEKWIRIKVETQPEGVRIHVTDSGRGIPEGIRDSLFHPFFTTKEVGKGTGLGLSISKGIIDSHGGSLILDTDCENTRFVIQLRSESRVA